MALNPAFMAFSAHAPPEAQNPAMEVEIPSIGKEKGPSQRRPA
jgi:hypothetical protein